MDLRAPFFKTIYRHVNGTWLATHKISADSRWTVLFHERDASENMPAQLRDAAAGRLTIRRGPHRNPVDAVPRRHYRGRWCRPLRAELRRDACATREASRGHGRLRAPASVVCGAYVGTLTS